MAANVYVPYETEAEARAFIAGIRFVNHSRVEIYGLYVVPSSAQEEPEAVDRYVVHVVDPDRPKSQERKPPKGFQSHETKEILIE